MATQQQRARRRRQRQRRAARQRNPNPPRRSTRQRRPGGLDLYLASRFAQGNNPVPIPNVPRAEVQFQAPAANGILRRSSRPLFNGTTTMRVQHREYLCNTDFADENLFPSVSALAVKTFPINPGQYITCPWLSPIAGQFEEYRFLSLKMEYRTCIGSATSGFTYLSVDYDASDGAPMNKQSIDTLEGTRTGSTWSNFDMPCDPVQLRGMLGGWRYVRPGSQPPNTDIKLYDSGFLIVGTSDRQDNSRATRGDVWVSYDVEFRKPQTDVYETAKNLSKRIESTSTPTSGDPWGTAPKFDGQLEVDVVQDVGDSTVGTLEFQQPGSYLLTALMGGTGFVGNQLVASIPAGYVGSLNNEYAYLSGTTTALASWIIEAISVPFKAKFEWTGTNTTRTFLSTLLSTYNAGGVLT